jgi:plastocyanin
MTSIESRIRWAGLLIIAGLIVLFVSLLSSHPLAFMLLLAVGCPLILVGVLLYLWSLAGDGSGRVNTVLIAILLIPLVLGACGNEPPVPSSGNSAGGLPAFDPSTATAKVAGKLIFEGTAPTIPSLKIGRDPFCQKNGQSIFKKQALLTEGGAPRNVIVYVRSGFDGRSYATPQEAVVLDQQECVYVPHVLTVMKGQKLRILNGDPTFHNVHAESRGDTVFNIAQASQGAEDIQTFSKAAMPYRIGCDFHSWMVSYVGVFEHPFHTTSGETGKYELRLPPGKYEIAAWHEKFGEQVASVEVAANASAELDFKFSAAPSK